MRIDESDENDRGERTWGVVTRSGYVVVTEDLDDGSLRCLTIMGTATEDEHAGAKGLVDIRRRKEEEYETSARKDL